LIFFFLCWPDYKKTAVIVSFISVAVVSYLFIIKYKEDYCWRLADKTANGTVIHNDLFDYEKEFMGNEATGISDWLRIHLKCDREIKFIDVILKNKKGETRE